MKDKHRIIAGCVLILIMMISISACGGKTSSQKQPSANPANTVSTSPQGKATDSGSAQQAVDPNAELTKLAATVQTKGPNGEEPASAETLMLTDEDIQQLKHKKVKVAISMHYMGNDLSNTIVNAMKEQFEKMGMELIGVTDANFKPDKQTSDIETILAKNPDVLISIPTDAVAMAPAFQKAADQGVKIVFMNQAAAGMKPGKDYVTIVTPDDYGNGASSAHFMARELGGKGKIGIIYHEADFPTTKIRYQAFKDVMKQYPGITIAAEQGIAGPDFPGDAEKATAAFLLKNPDIKGIWGVWDIPAEGIMAAARNAGRSKDLVITTVDLGLPVALEMAKGGMIKGVGAQIVSENGIADAKAAALAALGKPVAPFIVVNGLPTDKKNVIEAWKRIYHVDAPKELMDAAK
jgi:ribose transport system substrate-binding protein